MMLKAAVGFCLRTLQYGDPRGITLEDIAHPLVLLIKLLTCFLTSYECITINFSSQKCADIIIIIIIIIIIAAAAAVRFCITYFI